MREEGPPTPQVEPLRAKQRHRPEVGATSEGIAFRHWRGWRCFGDYRGWPTLASCRSIPEELTVLRRALATPRVITRHVGFTGGVYDRRGRLLPQSSRQPTEGSYRHLDESGRLPEPEDEEMEEAVYLGSLMRHFGHFLLEVVPRLWVFRRRSPRRVYFHAWRDADKGAPAFLAQTLSGLSAEHPEVRVIERPIRFRKLLAPTSTFDLGVAGSPECQAWCQELAARLAPGPPRDGPALIYMSRKGLGRRKRKLDDEDRLEALFADYGFSIVSPESLPFVEQVGLMRGCRVLAGAEGSALHQAMFMPAGGAVVAWTIATIAARWASKPWAAIVEFTSAASPPPGRAVGATTTCWG
jgi:hypothetical protein